MAQEQAAPAGPGLTQGVAFAEFRDFRDLENLQTELAMERAGQK